MTRRPTRRTSSFRISDEMRNMLKENTINGHGSQAEQLEAAFFAKYAPERRANDAARMEWVLANLDRARELIDQAMGA